MVLGTMIYGMFVTVTCPVCNEAQPLVYNFGNERLDTVILAVGVEHKKLGPCDPAIRWMPEQLGYMKHVDE